MKMVDLEQRGDERKQHFWHEHDNNRKWCHESPECVRKYKLGSNVEQAESVWGGWRATKRSAVFFIETVPYEKLVVERF